MKLEFIEDLTDGGKYHQVSSENLFRLYDFDEDENTALISYFQQLAETKETLNLASISFIEILNENLLLSISENDEGIVKPENSGPYTCFLTRRSYLEAIEKMKAIGDGHTWLCETSVYNIDFLYSPGGDW